MTRQTIILFACLLTSACGLEGGRPQTGFAPVLPPAAAPQVALNGAIFQPATGYSALHEGTRARRVGDLVTVMLVEDLDSTKSTSASTDREGSAGIDPPTAGLLSFLNPDALNASAQSSFNGQGIASQRSTLTGSIAVTIAEVRPNGTALVVGERRMQLSQGDEWVQFAGIMRLADVSAENRVLSTQIADAQIIYGGSGAIQQASRPGWLSRFFNIVSPF